MMIETLFLSYFKLHFSSHFILLKARLFTSNLISNLLKYSSFIMFKISYNTKTFPSCSAFQFKQHHKSCVDFESLSHLYKILANLLSCMSWQYKQMMIQPKQPTERIIRADMAIYIEKPTHNWQLFTPIFFAIYLKSNNNYTPTKCPVSFCQGIFYQCDSRRN